MSWRGTQTQGLICTFPGPPTVKQRTLNGTLGRCSMFFSNGLLGHTRKTRGSCSLAGESWKTPHGQLQLYRKQSFLNTYSILQRAGTEPCTEMFIHMTFRNKWGFWEEASFFHCCSGGWTVVQPSLGCEGFAGRWARRWDWKKVSGSGVGNAVLRPTCKKLLFIVISHSSMGVTSLLS